MHVKLPKHPPYIVVWRLRKLPAIDHTYNQPSCAQKKEEKVIDYKKEKKKRFFLSILAFESKVYIKKVRLCYFFPVRCVSF